ncbi:HAD family hydrolase [Cellulomonas sp. NPDC055163]
MNLPAAVLLDLDGTLVDSEPLWSTAAADHARLHGCSWSPLDAAGIAGLPAPDVAALLHQRGVPLAAERIAELLHEEVGLGLALELPWRAGALDLLTLLRWAEVPSALVSTSRRSLAELVVRATPVGTLRTVVSGDDVHRLAPHPEAYLAAARALGVDPARCLVVEDSSSGVAAALAAGTLVFAVDPSLDLPPRLSAHPRLVRVDGLVPVVELLSALLARG